MPEGVFVFGIRKKAKIKLVKMLNAQQVRYLI
jgi:hypothetical protein